MTLEEARAQYLGKTCDIHWGPIDRLARPNEATMRDTKDVVIKEVYQNCHNVILFLCEDKIYTAFPIERLKNPR